VLKGRKVTLGHLLTDPGERSRSQPAICLLLRREGQRMMLPADDLRLKIGDRLLFCGRQSARGRMEWCLQNHHALKYILTGELASSGWIWRKLQRRRQPESGDQALPQKDDKA